LARVVDKAPPPLSAGGGGSEYTKPAYRTPLHTDKTPRPGADWMDGWMDG